MITIQTKLYDLRIYKSHSLSISRIHIEIAKARKEQRKIRTR